MRLIKREVLKKAIEEATAKAEVESSTLINTERVFTCFTGVTSVIVSGIMKQNGYKLKENNCFPSGVTAEAFYDTYKKGDYNKLVEYYWNVYV